MTIYRAQFIDTPGDPFRGAALRCESDGAIAVEDGAIVARGDFAGVRRQYPDAATVDLREGLVVPGLIDTHVHYPQLRVIGALGMPLLDWLDHCALPEEARFADTGYASAVAAEFVASLTAAGTTTALVFGAHFADAVDALFAAAGRSGLRITSGLVVSDRLLRPELHTTPQRAYDEGRELAQRWHGQGRLRYAVIPRFSLSCSEQLLTACKALHDDVPGSWFTTHINENPDEIAKVQQLFGGSYLDSYDQHGLVSERGVFAHNVHPTDPELKLIAASGAAVAHCPTSNAALGSGLFPLDRHVAHDVPVALGSDVGAGTGFSLFKEGLQAYFLQRLRGGDGVPLSPADLLYLATAAGAAALGLADQVGDFSVGKRFDAVWVRPEPGSPLGVGLRQTDTPELALAKVFAQATTADVAGVWLDGVRVKP